ncbi:hypothetical protein [Carboxylicivirga sp. RSCT41]|uniref:hypothetical protein n=1 Tax=Carboxylicivirga agarovorans TaxID=3417570 RepID=UPI003D32DFFA
MEERQILKVDANALQTLVNVANSAVLKVSPNELNDILKALDVEALNKEEQPLKDDGKKEE